jgi:lincosamide nucleotidyltransferase A/C/D/E
MSREMTADDVLAFLALMAEAGVGVWIEGGWAVDACLGEQTRPHADLDIVIEKRDLEAAVATLRARGYDDVPRDDTRPWNFVLGDDAGHEIDFHVIGLDEQGRGIYGPPENDDFWPAAALRWSGVVAGQPVRCTSPAWLVASHAGYELKEKDRADVTALCERFEIDLPDG